MSPKQRFVVMVDPEQLLALREIEERTGATPSEQVRRGIELWLESQGVTKSERKRVAPRKRS